MQERKYQSNDLIITYGDLGSEYYILDKGVVEILVYKDGVDPKDPELSKKVAFSKYINTGIGFGEIALLYNDKRTATVRAAEPCLCWVLEGKIFKNIIIKQNLKRMNIQPTFLDHVDLFSNLDKYDKLKLINMLSTKIFNKGDYIFREGDDGDNFYMIEDGEVECLKITNSVVDGSNEVRVRDLARGEHFGELALLTPGGGGKRYLSVRVKSDKCNLMYLGRSDFQKIVGNIS
jgi:CRP-like cAMP-binding protein